jgi:hypothetical protein
VFALLTEIGVPGIVYASRLTTSDAHPHHFLDDGIRA